MAIKIVDFPIKNGGSFHSYVSHYQRVTPGAELQNVANHLPSDVFLETPAWVPSKDEVLKPGTVGTIQLYQQNTWFLVKM